MSRLIIKNLAKSVTTDKLTEIFSHKGVVTDVQLKFSPDGKFRHFAFVGFKSEDEAEQARKHFDNTYVNGSKIKVEVCYEFGSQNKPRSWSKHSSDSSAFKKLHSKSKETNENSSKSDQPVKKDLVVSDVLGKYSEDPLFSEFLESQSKNNIWGDSATNEKEKELTGDNKDVLNDNDIVPSSAKVKKENNDESTDNDDDNDLDECKNIAKADISDLEYMKMKTKSSKIGGNQSSTSIRIKQEVEDEELKPTPNPASTNDLTKKKKRTREYKFVIKIAGLKSKTDTKAIQEFFRPIKLHNIRKKKAVAFACFANEKKMNIALKKNGSFLDGKRIKVVKFETVSKLSDPATKKNNKWEEQIESLKSEETIADSGRIFVRNLSYTATEEDITAMFSKYGPVAEVVMPIDRFSRKHKGFAVVTFLMPEHAVKAYTELDGTIFQGRMFHLMPGKSKKSIEELLEMDGLTFQQKKALKAKAQAAVSTNWNTLFIGQNAVADLIAKNYNTTKEKVLDARGSGNLAVRMALGETELVNATRQFLLDHGVHLDAFNQHAAERSKTVLLVKNLPAETTRAEIFQLFVKFGELGRVVLPPSGVTAIVEYLEPSEARAAFRKLAYSKFKHVPLYLEWAPDNAFSCAFKKENAKTSSDSVKDLGSSQAESVVKEELETKEVSSNDEEEENEPPEADTTLFIKNLNFSTLEEAIKEHFKKCGPIHNVTVARKKDPKAVGKLLSMGYGFIQFKRKASLEKALKSYQNSVLDGNTLELKRSNRTLQTDVVSARKTTKVGKQTGSKILVRNVPFQATRREIQELFATFGEIKALRLPSKMAGSGSHRGFCFIEYYTKHDAKRAFKALCQSTHLYGRRLVLEWAASEENIDELRKKTANQFGDRPLHYQASKGHAEFEISKNEGDNENYD